MYFSAKLDHLETYKCANRIWSSRLHRVQIEHSLAAEDRMIVQLCFYWLIRFMLVLTESLHFYDVCEMLFSNACTCMAWWHKSAALGGQANRWHLCTYQFSASNVASRAGSRGHSNSNYTQFLVSMNQIFSHPCSLIIGQCSYSPICFMTFEILPDSAYASRAGTEELLWQKCFPFGKTAWRTE